jgi:hypothetical protein
LKLILDIGRVSDSIYIQTCFSFTSSSLSESSESSELSGFATTLAGGALDFAAGLATTFAGYKI